MMLENQQDATKPITCLNWFKKILGVLCHVSYKKGSKEIEAEEERNMMILTINIYPRMIFLSESSENLPRMSLSVDVEKG